MSPLVLLSISVLEQVPLCVCMYAYVCMYVCINLCICVCTLRMCIYIRNVFIFSSSEK